jgi:hypothetical protein
MTAIDKPVDKCMERPATQSLVDMSKPQEVGAIHQTEDSDCPSSVVKGGMVHLDDPIYRPGTTDAHIQSAAAPGSDTLSAVAKTGGTDNPAPGTNAASDAAVSGSNNGANIDFSKMSLVQLEQFAGEVITAIQHELQTLTADTSGNSPLDNTSNGSLQNTYDNQFNSANGNLVDSTAGGAAGLSDQSLDPNNQGIDISGNNTGTITINDPRNLPIEISGANSGSIVVNEGYNFSYMAPPMAQPPWAVASHPYEPVLSAGGPTATAGNDFNVGNSSNPLNFAAPGNQFNIGDPSNNLNPINPDSPLNPIGSHGILSPFNPGSPLSPENRLNPLNPDNPLNPLGHNNPLNPLNTESPLNPLSTKNPLNPLNTESPLNPLSPKNPLNPLSSDNPLNPSNVVQDLTNPIKATTNFLKDLWPF